jgi:GT2 family glycosyltransferase
VISVGVVVPATDVPASLGRCLAAIEAAYDPPDEVHVVDGPPELSASGARNAGVARVTTDVVVFVDADVAVHPDAFRRIRAAFAADADLTAVYGSYDDTPAARSTVSAFRNLLHHHVHQAAAGPAETFWTGLGAVRRRAFLAAGGFDEARYPHPSIEDIDLGHSLTARGARILLDPAIQGTHLKVWTLRSMVWTDFARRGIPWVALQVRSRRPSSALNCGWRHRLSALACTVIVGTAVAGAPLLAVSALGALVGINRGFYGLLVRRLGVVAGVAGVALHGLHHLVSVAAVPAGVIAALAAPGPAGRPGRVTTVPAAGLVPGETAAGLVPADLALPEAAAVDRVPADSAPPDAAPAGIFPAPAGGIAR